MLRDGTIPANALMAIEWLADLKITGHPPSPLWDLPVQIAEEIRHAANIVNRPSK